MPTVPEPSGAGANARALKGLNPNDINPDEMDDVIMRIFKETKRQLAQLESVKGERLTPAEQERNARTLAQLERTMERLVKLEAERAAARKSKAAVIDGNGRKALETRIDRVLSVALKRMEREVAEGRASGTPGVSVEVQRTSSATSA